MALWLIPILPLLGFLANGLFGRRIPKSLVNVFAVGSVALAFAWVLKTVFGLSPLETKYIEHYYTWIQSGTLNISVDFAVDRLTAIMLLNAGAEAVTFQVSRFVKYLGAILLAAFLGLISLIIQSTLPRTEGVTFGAFQGTALDVGRKLFTSYLWPFEITSVLILIAIVGAIVLARKEI